MDPRTFRPTALGVFISTAFLATTSPYVVAQELIDDDDDPSALVLNGTVRDFRERTEQGGHPDFERRPSHGFGQYCGNVSSTLGEDGKPVYTGDGWKLTGQWLDPDGHPICHLLFDSGRGDAPGAQGVSDGGGIESADTFASWFRDVPGTNMSAELSLTLVRQEDGTYVFDDRYDAVYEDRGGFFPIEDQLFGNPGGSPDRNFHFTYELHTQFRYDDRLEQMFTFIGDDDVWVFINGQLVIDLGGVHAAVEQTVDLTRLDLEHGMIYDLDFFFAERHRTQSNFRIQTNLTLESINPTAITNAFD